MSDSCNRALDCQDQLPDACTNDEREENLIYRQQKDDDRSWIRRLVDRERNLLIAGAILIVLMNFSTGRYLLYPFKIFSTWVHEMCHGIAALLMGGSISKLQIFGDGSGLAYTATSGDWRQAFVSSGGYPGTACTGCALLLYRRTTLGPTIGMLGLGIALLLSCALWVRNQFGLLALIGEGIVLILFAWKLPAVWLDNLYNFLALTVSLNAVESIQDLFGDYERYAGGEVVTNTDAHSVAETWGGDYRLWAIYWFCLSIVMTIVGIVFAFDARQFSGNASSTNYATGYISSTSNSRTKSIFNRTKNIFNNDYQRAASPRNVSPAVIIKDEASHASWISAHVF